MPISDVISIAISVSGAGPTRAGFGEPLIAASGLWFSGGVREYSSVASMISDGASVNHPAVLAADQIFGQQPSPAAVKVGKRSLPPTQTLHLTALSTSTQDTYQFAIAVADRIYHTITVASTGVPNTDIATINTAVTTLGLTGLTATHTGPTMTLTMTIGVLMDVKPDLVHMSFADITTDPGIATDLAAILAADSAWYGLVLDSQSPAEIAAAAVWTEANKKLFIWNSTDTADADPASTSDIFYTEKQLAHTRSAGLFSASQLLSYSGAAWMGRLFPTDAGSENWAFKTLSGVLADPLTDTQIHAVENKNGSVYTTLFGLNLTQFGKRPDGEWIDITRGVDALTNDMQVGVLALQANNKKIPFTDAGIDMYRSTITGSLKRFTDIGFIAASPAPFVSLPLAAAVDSTNKAARNLPGVTFTATLAGAINSTTVQGVLTV